MTKLAQPYLRVSTEDKGQNPARGLLMIEEGVPNLAVLGKPVWKRRGGRLLKIIEAGVARLMGQGQGVEVDENGKSA